MSKNIKNDIIKYNTTKGYIIYPSREKLDSDSSRSNKDDNNNLLSKKKDKEKKQLKKKMFLISICLIILIGFIITIFIIVSKKTKTKLKLKRIKIASKSNENILVEGMNTTISLNKVIIYDISEYKQFTTGIENNTIYTYSILLVNKCLNTKKEIEDWEITGINNFRNLEKSKEEPSICLFNITNNNIILSIKCPMYFSENQKSEIILI